MEHCARPRTGRDCLLLIKAGSGLLKSGTPRDAFRLWETLREGKLLDAERRRNSAGSVGVDEQIMPRFCSSMLL